MLMPIPKFVLVSMPSPLRRATVCLSTAVLAVAGCGGGGGGDGTNPPAGPSFPNSGSYAWVLKSQGSTSSLRSGLSLVHPDSSTVEYLVEPSSAGISDVTLVASGTVDASALKASDIKPHTLIYIVNGDVRSLPMQANGAAPKSRVQRAQSSNACRVLQEGTDLASPLNSRYVLATAGADGRCGNSDDERAELSFSATGVPMLKPIADGVVLGLARNPSTLAPLAWIFAKKLVLWSGASPVTIRSDSQAGFSAVVASSHRVALVDDGARLSLIEFANDGAASVRPLDASTGGGNWQSIGFDADSFFVYRNSSNAASGNWSVLRIARTAGSVTPLASGAGLLSNASMGNARLYGSVIGVNDNRLMVIGKTLGAGAQAAEITANSVFTSVQTSAHSVHQLFRVTNIGTAAVSYAIEMIDETGARLYATNAGGFTMSLADAKTRNFNASESRSHFLFVSGFGNRGFSDAALVAYDTAARGVTAIGNLPGVVDFGQDVVFANLVAGPGNFMGGFAGRSSAGVIQEVNAKVFSFDLGVANSLKPTTTQQ